MPNLGVDTLPSQKVPQKILKKKYLPILYAHDLYFLGPSGIPFTLLCPTIFSQYFVTLLSQTHTPLFQSFLTLISKLLCDTHNPLSNSFIFITFLCCPPFYAYLSHSCTTIRYPTHLSYTFFKPIYRPFLSHSSLFTYLPLPTITNS